MNYNGRQQIFTDVDTITYENVLDVLRKAMSIHAANASDSNFLIDFEKGKQPLMRTKTYRSDIDIQCVDNLANEITNFKTSYQWSNPITLVQRGKNDSGKQYEADAITLLNECFDSEDARAKTQELAYFVEVTGVGFTMLDVNTEYVDGDSYFRYLVLDPRNTFVIRSSNYPDKRVMMAVTYSMDGLRNKHFTCFTNDTRFEIENMTTIVNGKEVKDVDEWLHKQRSGERNMLGIIPIVEWIRAYDRMGCFERQIDDMNTLNIMQSDFANDVDQNTQCIWHGNDIDFPKDEEGNDLKPQSNDWLLTYTVQNGTQPRVTPLSVDYDYNGIQANIINKRTLILQKCSVPQRNDNSGGSTGIAMSDATGWSQAEVEANKQQAISEISKIQEIKIALKIINDVSVNVPGDSPLRKLRYSDVKPNIKRQKTYEMTTKINAYATAIKHGIDYKSMLAAINFFDDPMQVAEDSKDTTERFLDSIFNKKEVTEEIDVNETKEKADEEPDADRTTQDYSDQEDNSPMMQGK